VRLDRLAVAAEDAIAAARAGDPGEMRGHLRRFDALTSALWTVQDAVRESSSGTRSTTPTCCPLQSVTNRRSPTRR
jgi:hypothetical protein